MLTAVASNAGWMIGHSFFVAIDVAGSGTNSGELLPGQPLSLQWGVYGFETLGNSSEAPDYSTATATILFNGVVVWGPSAERIATVAPSPLGRPFYRVGQTNRLTLTVDSPGAEQLSAFVEITIVADADPDWTWSMRPPMLFWKSSSYTISGSLHSNAGFAQLTALPTLHEDAPSLGSSRDMASATGGAIALAPGATSIVPFGPITQVWHWIDEITIDEVGPTSVEFDYIARFSASDEYGNVFEAPTGTISSSSLPVMVNVSEEKKNAGLGGAAAQLGAIGFTAAAGIAAATIWSSPAALVFLGIAATLEATARAALMAALDPPEPDPNFAQDVTRPSLTKLTTVSPEIAPIATFAATAKHFIETRNAMSVVEGRILGARKAGDAVSLQKQNAAYATMLATMKDAAVTLIQQVDKLSPAKFDFAKAQAQIAALQKGFPPDLRTQFMKIGLSKDDLVAFEQRFSKPDAPRRGAETLMAPQHTFTTIANGMAGVFASVAASAPATMHGARPLKLPNQAVDRKILG